MKSRLLSMSLAVLALAFVQPVSATLVLDVGPGGSPIVCGAGLCGNAQGRTFGWAFDVTSSITIDGLGVWDAGADGIGPAVDVGLWIDGGALLATTNVSSASALEPSSGDGAWRFEDIVSLTLAPGSYVLGSVFFDSTPDAQFFTAFTTIPEVVYVQARDQGTIDGGLLRPDLNFGPDGVFGPTMRLVSVSVPEPATGILALIGLALAFGLRRRGSA